MLLSRWLRRQPAAALPPSCRTAAAAAAALPMPPSCHCCASAGLLLPPSCHRRPHHTATAAKLLPLLPRCHCRRHHHAATAAKFLLLPRRCHCRRRGHAAAKLLLPPPSCPLPLSCRCCYSASLLPPMLPSFTPQPSCTCHCHAATLLPLPPSCPLPQSCPLLPGCHQAARCDIFGGVVVCCVWMCDISSAFYLEEPYITQPNQDQPGGTIGYPVQPNQDYPFPVPGVI
jgi:hypothetical protein